MSARDTFLRRLQAKALPWRRNPPAPEPDAMLPVWRHVVSLTMLCREQRLMRFRTADDEARALERMVRDYGYTLTKIGDPARSR